MATKQWLVENPKVLGYLPKTIYDQLQEFKAEQSVSVSKALAMILESYFELEPTQSSAEPCTDERLSNLEQQVAAIKVVVDQLAGQPNSTEDVVATRETPPKQSSPTTDTSQPRTLQFNKHIIIPANNSSSLGKRESTNKGQPTVTTRSHQDGNPEEPPIYKTVRIPRDQSVESEEPVQDSTEQVNTDIETTPSRKRKSSKDLSAPSLSEPKPQLGGKRIQKFFKGVFPPPSLKPSPPSDQDQD